MKRQTILIVDDEPNIIAVMAHKLKKEGYAVLNASDGQQALDLAKSQRPDLIIADVMMPVMDGYELCRRIKEFPELRGIPFIFLTVKDGLEHRIYAYSIGAHKYLTKPIKMDQLLNVVNIRLKAADEAKALLAKKVKKFEGDLSLVSLFTLLDMYYIGNWTGAIEIKSPDGCTGRIEIRDAEIAVCSINGKEDSGTFIQLLAWNQGMFTITHE